MMKMLPKLLAILTIMMALVSCGVHRGVYVEDLKQPLEKKEVYLASDIVLKVRRGPRSPRFKLTLSKGVYRAKYINADGVYYKGPSAAIKTSSLDNSSSRGQMDGGFYVPNDSSAAIQWWYESASWRAWDENGRRVDNKFYLFDYIMGFPEPGHIQSSPLSAESTNVLRKLVNSR